MILVLRQAAISVKMSMPLLILFPPKQAPLTGGGSIPAMPAVAIGQQFQVQTLLVLSPPMLFLLPPLQNKSAKLSNLPATTIQTGHLAPKPSKIKQLLLPGLLPILLSPLSVLV